MALIVCPECGNNISDKADKCIHCGFPLKEHMEKATSINEKPYTLCPKCNSVNPIGVWTCENCGHKYKDKEYNPIYPNKKPFKGIYKYDMWGNREEVRCINCKSENCSEYKDQIVVPDKTKTTVSLNLNPLKPFTVANVKEKVVRKGYSIPINRFICNDCGEIFN